MDEKPDLIAVLQHYGADTYRCRESGWSDVKCPFHDDRTASARVNIELGKFHCFACDVAGDSIDLIQGQEGGSVGDALRFARDHFGYESPDVRQVAAKPRRYRSSFMEEDD